MNTVFLLTLALLPGFILMFFILYMDRNEREPLGQVLKIMLLGALSVVPAVFSEWGLGLLPIYSNEAVINAVVVAFVQVAWVEELCKLGVVLLFIWGNKHFNEENDGIVYVGASALGFAMLENVAYVLRLGITTGILRSITAMPLHCFTGVLMGYYTGLAKFAPGKHERNVYLLKGFFLAYLIHGLYNALLLTRTPAAVLIFPLVLGLFIFGIKFLKKGRALSLARSAAVGEGVTAEQDAAAQKELLIQTNPKNQVWKIIISRTLLTASGLFWALLISGMVLQADRFSAQGAEIILGSILLSFFPVLIGVLLEVSYRKKRKMYRDLRQKEPEPEPELKEPHFSWLPAAAPLTSTFSLPGQMWRVALGRTLLTLSALFWAVIVLTVVANLQSLEGQGGDVLMGAWIIGFFPAYAGILLEDSYRKRNKRFNQLLRRFPAGQAPPGMLTLSPPRQSWKIFVSRFLFGLGMMYWVILLMVHFFGGQSGPDLFQVIFGGLATTIVPLFTAVLLEVSYRKKQLDFWSRQEQAAMNPGKDTLPAVQW
ncbi:MAG: PrsW family intramembrane metalloprotease [bacterium]|nr:PrsW family intramembrane metalloprotease [bacterium]